MKHSTKGAASPPTPPSSRPRAGLVAAALVLLASTALGSPGGELGTDEDELADLSLEELMNIDVSIVSRSKRKLSDLPAAVYVLTGDEIRRAGHSSIPEALRMVPGFHVSRWTHNAWDVTARGYGTGISLTSLAFLNQLLVMIDGVVVYTPLFAGVWWPLQDIDLGDVDRIEVVRGPGGILWGSNAIHGVVHIITKDAADTQGLRVYGREGRDDRHRAVRVGGPIGENGHFRVWGKWAEYDTLHNPFLDIDGNWELGSGGFRTDFMTDSGKHVSFWGRVYEGKFEDIAFDLVTFQPFRGRSDKDGYMFLGSIDDPESGSRWQMWYSLDLQDIVTFADIRIETVDFEYQKRFDLTDVSSLTVGAGYRAIFSDLEGDDPFYLDYQPSEVDQRNLRAFAVDTMLFPDIDVEVTLGLQVESNEFTGMELQPTARAAWRPRDDFMTWAAVTRAVRTPSLEERTLSPGSFIIGNPDFRSEELLAYELGFRSDLSEHAVLDVAFFYNDYDNVGVEVLQPSGQGLLTNDAEGHAWGAEVALDLRPTDRWKIRTAYSYLNDEFEAFDQDLITGDYSPNHHFNLRSYYDLTDDLELDAALYVVDGLADAFDEAEYVRADVRMAWQIVPELEIAFGVQDLGNATRSELDEFDNPRRAAYVSASFQN